MANDHQPITLLDQRRAQAALMARLYEVLRDRFDQPTALGLIAEAVQADALAAGAAFAATAEAGPSLEHFAGVIELQRAGGRGLKIEGLKPSGDEISYTVTRCGYIEMYRAMGIGPQLAAVLSCVRDAAFAEGYDPRLSLERGSAIGHGDERCLFRYIWREADNAE